MAYELFDSKAARFDSPQFTIRSDRIAFNADAGDILSLGPAPSSPLFLRDSAGRHNFA